MTVKGKLKLRPPQWKRLTSIFCNIGQAIIIFALAVIFVPEAVSLSQDFPKSIGFIYLLFGLMMVIIGVIIAVKEK